MHTACGSLVHFSMYNLIDSDWLLWSCAYLHARSNSLRPESIKCSVYCVLPCFRETGEKSGRGNFAFKAAAGNPTLREKKPTLEKRIKKVTDDYSYAEMMKWMRESVLVRSAFYVYFFFHAGKLKIFLFIQLEHYVSTLDWIFSKELLSVNEFMSLAIQFRIL